MTHAPCNCIEEVNKKLAERGDELDLSFDLMAGKSFLVLKTVRLKGKRGKPLLMLPSFCPFCGKKYA